MININEIKKDLYKTKNMATFSHYSFGKLFYTFDALDTTFMFPIKTTENVTRTFNVENVEVVVENALQLSSDLGETNFGYQIKASDLNRWIAKAIESDELVNMKQ